MRLVADLTNGINQQPPGSDDRQGSSCLVATDDFESLQWLRRANSRI
jgi:hypothetical protein